MPKVILAEGCREFDAPSGRRYFARQYGQGGSFDLPAGDAKALVALGGAVASLAGSTRRAIGWRCPACGFGSFLKSCGRCGTECVREGGDAS